MKLRFNRNISTQTAPAAASYILLPHLYALTLAFLPPFHLCLSVMTSTVHNSAMNLANPNPSSGDGDRVNVSQLLERVSSLEQSVVKLLSEKKRTSSQQHLFRLEQQHETCSSPRLRDVRVPYPSTSGLSSAGVPFVFEMPLHYPRFSRADYEAMEEWRLDRLLEEYGLPIPSTLEAKRELAIGTFLWES